MSLNCHWGSHNWKTTLAAAAVIGGGAVFALYSRDQIRYALRSKTKNEFNNPYESVNMLNEYLTFNYGGPSINCVFDGPQNGFDFPKRTADVCLEYYKPAPDIPNRALDIGCAVGRASFELAAKFSEVVGIDYSHGFIKTCQALTEQGSMQYETRVEGHLVTKHKAVVPTHLCDPVLSDFNPVWISLNGIELFVCQPAVEFCAQQEYRCLNHILDNCAAIPDRNRCKFQQGDACHLPLDLGKFGCVLAANLICRLPNPKDFLLRLSQLVAPGGICVITSPYTFLEDYTPKEKWLGGYIDSNGSEVRAVDTMKQVLGPHFDFVDAIDLPFLIRETLRKHQWTVAHTTIWKRKRTEN